MARQPKIQDAFNDCAERLMAGASVEDCLRQYPEQASELKPLLETLITARSACNIEPRPAFRTRARYEFRNALAEANQTKPRYSWQWNLRLATVVPLVVAVLLLGGGGVIAASSNSLPDQPLYAVKLGVEKARLRFTPSLDGKVKLYALMADRRAGELGLMAEEGKAALAESTAERMEESLNLITASLLGSNNNFSLTAGAVSSSASDGKSSQGGATLGAESVPARTQVTVTAAAATSGAGAGSVPTQAPPVIAPILPTPATTVVPAITLPPISVNVPTPLVTLPPGTTVAPNLPSVDPALLKYLTQNAADPAALQSLLAKVPESSRPAVLQAIALIQNYQQLLKALAASNPGK